MRFFACAGVRVKGRVVLPSSGSASAGIDRRLRRGLGQQAGRPISRIVARLTGKPPTLTAALRSSAAELLIYHRSAWPASSPKRRAFPTRHVTTLPKQQHRTQQRPALPCRALLRLRYTPQRPCVRR